MAISPAALKAELQNDPIGYGYAALIAAGNHGGLADMLNLVRTGANGGPQIIFRKTSVSGSEIYQQILWTDLVALPGAPTPAQLSKERRDLAFLTGLPAVQAVALLNPDGSDASIVANLRGMLTAGSGTLTRLVAIASRNGSRGEQLGGVGTRVSGYPDIPDALNS